MEKRDDRGGGEEEVREKEKGGREKEKGGREKKRGERKERFRNILTI